MLDGSRIARLFSENKSVCPKVCDDMDRLKCGTLQTRMQQVRLPTDVARMQQQQGRVSIEGVCENPDRLRSSFEFENRRSSLSPHVAQG